LTLRSGICVPDTCSPEKVIEFANSFLREGDLVATTTRCLNGDPYPLTAQDILMITILVVVVSLLAASTTYEIYMTKQDRE
jgi:hypothetical protein